jgi:hypothetical protein
MRIVRWAPQERADQPDLTAMSYLVLGEFRRTLRGLVLGEDANYLLRGFQVLPQAVPDATVVIKLNPGGGGALSFALGAENLGARMDYGQLIGGDDSDAHLEGNATVTLNFAGQPVAPYTVQIRFNVDDAVPDNRAFWNPVPNTEFIASTDTRTLPTWEARFSGAASAEWIDIATVNWDGVAVDPGDITDLRTFAFEGAPAFSRATQDGTGGMEDFDHSTDRAANGVNAIYPVLRSLGRQIQDLKGANGSGVWDWFSRPYAVAGTTAPLAAQRTRSLRAVDVAMFTVADGTVEWGDFNGATGLDDCLAYIDANEATLPKRVQVFVKSRAASVPDFTIGTARSFQKHLEIIGLNGDNNGGRIGVSCSHAAGTAIAISSPGSLTLVNIDISTTVVDTSVVSVSQTNSVNFLKLLNSRVAGRQEPATTGWAIDAPGKHSDWRDSEIVGRVRLHDNETTDEDRSNGGRIVGCSFSSCVIVLNDDAAHKRCTKGLVFENCAFFHGATTVYAGSPYGLIDGRGAVNVAFKDCRFHWGTLDMDCVHLGHLDLVGHLYPTRQWHMERCYFDAPTSRSHLINAGNNGAEGTGWHVYAEGDVAAGDKAEDIKIENCVFNGNAAAISTGNIDAGGVKLKTLGSSIQVRGNRFEYFNCTTAGHVYAVYVRTVDDVWVTRNTIHRWGSNILNGDAIGIALHVVDDPHVIDNVIDGAGTAIMTGTFTSGLYLQEVNYAIVRGNHFREWNRDQAVGKAIVHGNDVCKHSIFKENIFENCGGFVILSVGLSFEHNVIAENIVHRVTGETGSGFSTANATAKTHNTWLGNVFSFEDGAATVAIATGDATEQVYIGNNCIPDGGGGFFGDIDQIGPPTANSIGYNETPDFNNADYT